ncbi:hypothetical protein [Streptomyces sp. Ru73]|uniref:hypothetical protein n=1 Tax=Streptomyces sp. Ru73 TaxID=2080748 RepID=UPI0021562AEA|nr:hypothetical protein [Streptomyces sp. Ru73]
MLKHYYRLVYWKRRLTRTGPGRRVRAMPHRTAALLQRARPLLVFAVLVLIVLGLSAVLA